MPKNRRRLIFWVTATVVLCLGGSWVASLVPSYPYGYTHACDKQLYFALIAYSSKHDGWFPKGGSTPEDCLAMLCTDFATFDLVSGKYDKGNDLKLAVEEKGVAPSNLISWRYMEGLRADDDNGFAIFWDQTGLGHHGEKLPNQCKRVFFISSAENSINANEWDAFVREQIELWATKKGVRKTVDDFADNFPIR